MMNEPRLLFVYGTLRRDVARHPFQILSRNARFRGNARVRGRLYSLGQYPGLAPDQGDGYVSGELYEIESNWGDVIATLDAYEGCSENDEQPHEYRREIVRAELSNGYPVQAWAYVMNRSPEGLPTIESGDFISWQSSGRAKSGR
jgi:gamma-glutamylcyclotransferase (GGCT)/AIG2-like uncharacterized protein YtfP